MEVMEPGRNYKELQKTGNIVILKNQQIKAMPGLHSGYLKTDRGAGPIRLSQFPGIGSSLTEGSD